MPFILLNSVFLFFVLSCNSKPAQASPESEELVQSFRTHFQKLFRDGQFNGVVLLASNGRIIYQEALGLQNAQTGRKLTKDSVFNLASVSKPITATAILILAEEGKLSLDDPVSRYIPEVSAWGDGARDITIEQVLHHTSGLPDYEDLAEDYFSESQQETIVEFIDNADIRAMLTELKPGLQFVPGSEYSYSNTGYLVLADIVEKTSGMNFPTFLRSRIFQPAGMNFTSVCVGRNQPSNKALGFYIEDDRPYIHDVEYLDGIYGDGNICSTAEDLLKFDQALRNGKLLKTDLATRAVEPGVLNNGETIDYGFGWELSEEGLAFHTGSWTGFRTYFIRDLQQGYTIIVLDNSSNEELYEQVDRLIEASF
tara:strand:- start:14904 stop:16007 length:1104 start_codon:yes stop_codon:yes gene_type:complete